MTPRFLSCSVLYVPHSYLLVVAGDWRKGQESNFVVDVVSNRFFTDHPHIVDICLVQCNTSYPATTNQCLFFPEIICFFHFTSRTIALFSRAMRHKADFDNMHFRKILMRRAHDRRQPSTTVRFTVSPNQQSCTSWLSSDPNIEMWLCCVFLLFLLYGAPSPFCGVLQQVNSQSVCI